MKDECCNKDDCDEMSYGGCGGDTGEDTHDCPTCCSRCFREMIVKGNPEAAEFTLRGMWFDLGIDPPTCCADLNGRHTLDFDGDTNTWTDGVYSLSLQCNSDCSGLNGEIAIECEESSSPITFDGDNWVSDGDGEFGLGCLQSGLNGSNQFVLNFGATLDGSVDTFGGNVTLDSSPTYGSVTLNPDGSFAYEATGSPPSGILTDSFTYTSDAVGGVFGSGDILVYPDPRIDVWQSANNAANPECCASQFPIPPDPYPPLPPPEGYTCCTNYPGALFLAPKSCDGRLSISLFGESCGAANNSEPGPNGCDPFVLSFDHFEGGTAYYRGDAPSTCVCGEGSGSQGEVGLFASCVDENGPGTGWSGPIGMCGGNFGCDLSSPVDLWCLLVFYGNCTCGCPTEDEECLDCLRGLTGAGDSDCWAGTGYPRLPCAGASIGATGFWVYAL